MTILFISDLHLSEAHPEITQCFLHFLNEEAPKASALYILGDLFEFWIGDDEDTPLQQVVATHLNELHALGIPIYFIHGNRDFLIGKNYAKRAGMQLLPETVVIDLFGTPTLIMHGDTLCVQDMQYQKFRKKVHNPVLQWLFHQLPLRIRQKIGLKIRQASQSKNKEKSIEIMDVDQNEVNRVMEAYQVNQLIHGHTHRPAIHEVTFSHPSNRLNHNGKRIVLGDWYTQGSILICHPDGFKLETRKFI